MTDAPPPSIPAEQRAADLLEGLLAQAPVPPPPAAERLALFAAAIGVAMLPILYVGAIAAIGYGLYLFDTAVLPQPNASGLPSKFDWYFFLVSLMTSFAVMLVLVVPLWPRSATRNFTLPLDPARAPLLGELVRRICGSLGSPTPRTITIHAGTGVAVRFDGRFGALSGARQLELGLATVAGLNLGSLAAALAQELAGARSGAAQLAWRVIGRCRHWIEQRSRGQASWERALRIGGEQANAAGGAQGRVPVSPLVSEAGGILYAAHAAVTIGRGLFTALEAVGRALTVGLIRRKTLAADAAAARLAGPAALADALTRLRTLQWAEALATQAEAGRRRGRKLPADHVALVLEFADRRPAQIDRLKEAWSREENASRLRGLSPFEERLRALAAAVDAAPLGSRTPGTALLADFPELCREATLAFHRGRVRPAPRPADLVPLDQFLGPPNPEDVRQERLFRFFGMLPPPDRPFPLADDSAAHAAASSADAAENYAKALARHRTAERQRTEALRERTARACRTGGTDPTGAAPKTREEEVALAEKVAAEPVLEAHEKWMGDRLADALRKAPAALADDRARMVALLHELERLRPERDQLAEGSLALDTVLALKGRAPSAEWNAALRRVEGSLRERIAAFRESIAPIPWPLADDPKPPTLRAYVLPALPGREPALQVVGLVRQTLVRCDALRRRVLARLVEIAERADP